MPSSAVLHRAPWVAAGLHSTISDGAVAVRSGRIIAVGPYCEICSKLPDAVCIDHPCAVLLPALINAHTHLELSHLAYLTKRPLPATFTGWIENMLNERTKVGFVGDVVAKAACQALADQQRDGVIAVADISNTGITRDLDTEFSGSVRSFKEYLGLNAAGVAPALLELENEAENHLCTAHAPYSTHADLLCALKERAAAMDHVFPIHVAEPVAETEMMSRGRGEIPDFLKRRGFWDNSFQPTGIDNSGAVQYLHQLGVLDNKTLCVHGIQVTAHEIELLATSGCKVCLCPGSNRYLKVGKAPVGRYLASGILPALGTDSLASNPKISLWREMQLLAEDHPSVEHADILAMATVGGAVALGLEADLGTLEPGKQADFLAVQLPANVCSAVEVYTYLVTTGSSIEPAWITS